MQRFLIVVGLVLMAPALHGAPPFGGLKFNAYTTNDTATIDARVAGLAGVGGFQSGTNVTIWSTNINSTALTIRAAPGVLYGWTWTPSGLRSYWGSTNYTIALDASGDAYFTGDLFGRSFYGDDATRTRVNSARAVAASNIWDASNIKFWGAAGDTNTDDTAIIKARIAATAGGMIKFPAGTYILSDTLLLTNVSVTLEGAEPVYDYDGTAIPSTVFKWESNPASGIGIIVTNDGTYGAGVYGHLQNIGIDGNSVLGTGMLLSQAQLVDSCRVVNCTGAGINLTNSFNSTHISRTALVANDVGLKLSGTAGTLASIEKCAIRLNTHEGILAEAGRFVTFDRCVVESNHGRGIWSHSTTNYYTNGTPVGPIIYQNGWLEENLGGEAYVTTDTTNSYKSLLVLRNVNLGHYATPTNIMYAGTNSWIIADTAWIQWSAAECAPTNEPGGAIIVRDQNRVEPGTFATLGFAEGGARDDGTFFVSGNGASNSASVFKLSMPVPGSLASPKVMGLDFLGYRDRPKARIVATDVSTNLDSSELHFYVADDNQLQERASIDRNGKLNAYGDASIVSNLNVGGGITSTGIVHRFNSGTVNTLVVTNGKAGFNVGNPQETLDAAATGSSLLKLTVTTPHSASAPAEVGLLLNSSVMGTEFPKGKIVGYEDNNNYASTELGVWLSDDTQALVPRLWINRSGYVGIGKTNATTLLDVNGDVTASNYWGNGSHLTGITNIGGAGTTNVFYGTNIFVTNAIFNGPVTFVTNITVGGSTTTTNLFVYDTNGVLKLSVVDGTSTAFGDLNSGSNSVPLTRGGIIQWAAYGYPAGTTNFMSGDVMTQTNLSGTNYSTFNLATQDKYSSGGQTNSGPIGAEGGLAVTGAFTVNGQTLGGIISTSTVANAYQLVTPAGGSAVSIVVDSPPNIDVQLPVVGRVNGSNFVGQYFTGNAGGLTNLPQAGVVGLPADLSSKQTTNSNLSEWIGLSTNAPVGITAAAATKATQDGNGATITSTYATGAWIQNSNQCATFTPHILYNTAVVTVIDPTNGNLQFIAQTNASGLTIQLSTNILAAEEGFITLSVSNDTSKTLTWSLTNVCGTITYNATNNDVGQVICTKPAYSSNNLWRIKQFTF